MRVAFVIAGGWAFFSGPSAPECEAQAAAKKISPPAACTDFGPQAKSAYILPYEAGKVFRVIRTTEHYTPGNGGVGAYAIDFDLPMRTPVVAARAGVVAAVQQGFPDGNDKDLEENYVFIRHDDGTIARYFHLTENGAAVKEGEAVRQGQVVGRSGNSGQSGGPHLHFDVQKCGPNLPPNYNQLPCGQTLPVTFRNTRPHPSACVPNESYTALAPPVGRTGML